jgi:hypothetical protein
MVDLKFHSPHNLGPHIVDHQQLTAAGSQLMSIGLLPPFPIYVVQMAV